jgi:calcineurin-like phosphoesterase family protein
MNKHLTESWNKTIKPEDEVYYLGDFSLTMTKRYARNLLYKLHGKKYMIKGNHDRTYMLNNYKNSGLIEWWDYSHEMSYEHNGKTYNFSLSHYPHYPVKGSDIICLFGHIHQRLLDDNINGMMLNVGVDNVGYEPLSIINIIEYYERNKSPMNNGIK